MRINVVFEASEDEFKCKERELALAELENDSEEMGKLNEWFNTHIRSRYLRIYFTKNRFKPVKNE
jgi:hypothetical protein